MFQNMQSLVNKQDCLEAFLEGHREEHYVALCISEKWLSQAKANLISFKNHHLAASFFRAKHNGGGVSILLRDDVDYVERKEISDMSVEYVIEVCAIELLKFDIILILLYWNGRETDTFYNQLKIILEHLQNKCTNKKIIIGGDFNVNVLIKSQQSSNLLNLMLEYNLKQYVREPTRVNKNSATCLDLIFTNFTKNFTTSVTELGFSDHKCVTINIEDLNQQRQKTTFWYQTKRVYNSKNIQTFKQELQKINWDAYISPHQNVNDNYNSLNRKLIDILDKTIPKRRITIKSVNSTIWLTRGIKISCRHKRLLRIHVTTSRNQILSQHYKSYEKTLKRIIIKSKKLQYIRKMNKASNKVKCMWQIINQNNNKKISSHKQNVQITINDKLTSDPKLVANAFNNLFVNAGRARSDAVPPPRGRPVLQPTENTMFLRPVELHEIYSLIRSLKSKTSYGIDELPSAAHFYHQSVLF
ncbi:uncharacterized protein LOC134680582 [Cydia fagiglandana]|uniref:uncharacterized protein LOC134680582 n=1 Tax=Cydia fagiglandana TaxID=1458189 RepID=UPI002FEE017B